MGTIKAIIGLIAIVAVFYAVYQVVPPELSNYSFNDDLRDIAMMAGANPKTTDQDLVNQVMQRAQDHQIPLAPEQISVQRIGTPGARAVYLSAQYDVPVSLPGYSFTLHFTPSSGNRGF